MYTVYLLQSNKSRHYIGYTSNLPQRIAQHNRKHRGYTYGLGETWRIIYFKSYDSKEHAQQVEKYLKSLKNFDKALDYISSGYI
jgi:putative endonuclease